MGRTAKIAVIAVLGGLFLAMVIQRAFSPAAPHASVPTMTGAGAPPAIVISERCRTVTAPDAECEAAWEAKRRHFFGQKD